jgi:NADH:ubiquinone oxidoreductase subunit 4 (subunit M)
MIITAVICICFLFALIAVFTNKEEQYLKYLSLMITVFSLIVSIYVMKYYPDQNGLFNFAIIISTVAFLVYLFSQSTTKWKS